MVSQVLVSINFAGLGFDDLLVALQSTLEKKGADAKDKPQKRQAIANIARCLVRDIFGATHLLFLLHLLMPGSLRV